MKFHVEMIEFDFVAYPVEKIWIFFKISWFFWKIIETDPIDTFLAA